MGEWLASHGFLIRQYRVVAVKYGLNRCICLNRLRFRKLGVAHSEDRCLGHDIEELKLRAESIVHALMYCIRYR